MFKTLRNAWKVEEIRKKILFTLFIVLIYRLGNAVPVPYINVATLKEYFNTLSNTVLGLYNVMSGGAFSSATVFALSIQPYINASIIIQLLCVAIPYLERLSKDEGEEGKKKIASITRYSTVAIALLQGLGYYVLLKNNSLLTPEGSSLWAAVIIIATFTAGSSLLMWMGEQITEFGIGNGISIILFVSIISRFPNTILNAISTIRNTPSLWWIYLLMFLGALAIIVLIVIVSKAERRIPIQYAKRVIGRKIYGGQSTYLPMQVNMSGVLPVIFASSIASIPATIASFFRSPAEGSFWNGFLKIFDSSNWVYPIIYFLLIVFFSYFYATIQFDPVEVSNNLQKNGGYVPGFRPGKPTADFLQKILSKVTLFGAIYLAIIAITPQIISLCSTRAANTGISVGGTSLIIVVGVALETVQALENQMLMRHYKGFLE